MSMLVWLIVPFYDFCGVDPSPLTVCKNCIFAYVFAVLLPDLSRLYCHSVQRMFLKMNTRHHTHKPVKKGNNWGRFSKRNCQEGQTASACQILCREVQPSPRYGYISTFQDGGRRYFGFLKFGTFNGPAAQ